uniref:Uncharacterized protein n=1 Tax=Ascaris lumbricoides TaxID=6252 RepID=A0A0M3HQH7_ASCLU
MPQTNARPDCGRLERTPWLECVRPKCARPEYARLSSSSQEQVVDQTKPKWTCNVACSVRNPATEGRINKTWK